MNELTVIWDLTLWWTVVLSWVYSYLASIVPGIVSASTAVLIRIKYLLKMNKWIFCTTVFQGLFIYQWEFRSLMWIQVMSQETIMGPDLWPGKKFSPYWIRDYHKIMARVKRCIGWEWKVSFFSLLCWHIHNTSSVFEEKKKLMRK